MAQQKRIILYFFCIVFFNGVNAQIDSLSQKILNNLDTLRFAKTDFGSFKILPYIAPTYSPETLWMLSAGGLLTFKVNKHDKKLNVSSVPFSFGYSSTGALNATLLHEIYWTNDKIRFIGDLQFKNMPDNYWGVGYENGLNISKTDSTTAYRRVFWQVKERVMFNLGNHLFLGPILDLNGTQANAMNTYMAQDEYIEKQGDEFFNTGIGVYLEHDSRDMPQNAYKGWYLGGNFVQYVNWFSNSSQFFTIELDYRQYVQIVRPGRTLAWQVKNKLCAGAFIPWTDMAMLGGPQNLRGYTLGRFRDETMVSALLEYRHMFRRKRKNKQGNYKSRFGYVTWLGGGGVAPAVNQLTNWLPNAGVGARFEVRSRMNIRVDYGFAKGEQAFYVTFNEAF